MKSDWDVVFVLPNFAAGKDRWSIPPRPSANLLDAGIDLGSACIAFAPQHDPRVERCVAADPLTGRLLAAFVDYRGKPIQPAVCIARSDWSTGKSFEAIIAFRNSVAASTVLLQRAYWALDRAANEAGWSDLFDFHPVSRGKLGLVAESPALRAYFSPGTPIMAMPSAHVSAGSLMQLPTDRVMYELLGEEWRATFERARADDQFIRALTRSLEIAFVAASSPTKHGGSIYEWGLQLAMWVSAIEVLLSGLHGSASEKSAIDLLGSYEWSEYRQALRRADREIYIGARKSKNFRRANALQHSCHLLYAARNAFLHGNEITQALMHPWGTIAGPDDEPAPSVVTVAPIVYRMALRVFMSTRHADPDDDDSAPLAEISDWMHSDGVYGRALERIYGIDDATEEALDDETHATGIPRKP